MKSCNHKWEQVEVVDAAYPMPVYRDECKHCHCVGEPDWNNPDSNGNIQIKAKPIAKVISLCEYRKQREESNGKERTRIG